MYCFVKHVFHLLLQGPLGASGAPGFPGSPGPKVGGEPLPVVLFWFLGHVHSYRSEGGSVASYPQGKWHTYRHTVINMYVCMMCDVHDCRVMSGSVMRTHQCINTRHTIHSIHYNTLKL